MMEDHKIPRHKINLVIQNSCNLEKEIKKTHNTCSLAVMNICIFINVH